MSENAAGGHGHDAPGSGNETHEHRTAAPEAGSPGTTARTPTAQRTTRRRFLQTSGLGAASVALAAAPGPTDDVHDDTDRAEPNTPDGPPLTRAAGPGFDHLVVLMYENRSFDNVLGYLYDEDDILLDRAFDGLAGGEHSNIAPDGRLVRAHPYTGETDTVMSSPDPDPGEEYPHVNRQLFGVVDPQGNADLPVARMTAPFNAPPAGATATMSGFVADYVGNYRAHHRGAEPPPEIVDRIMGSFTPSMLPVVSTLAKEFAVFDAWFSAVPSQTYCNRSFFHASTSHGYVTNHEGGGYGKWLRPELATATTIFERLEQAGRSWRVYFDDRQFVSMTGFIHAPALERFWKTNFFPLSVFYEDVATGALPDYAFVEPRMLYDHNDMHPPYGPDSVRDEDGDTVPLGTVSDVRAGEALLHEVYDAIRTSANPDGSNAVNTMLFVTFDEHGGTYDHVPPPPATPPEGLGETEMGFAFDRLGPRVPAIAISAYTQAGTVLGEERHHGSIIATLCERFGLEPLTARDRDARTIVDAVNLTEPREPSLWPQPIPQWLPKNPESDDPVRTGEDEMPLTAPGVGLMGLLVTKYGSSGEKVPRTYREAFDAVERYGKGLFGTG